MMERIKISKGHDFLSLKSEYKKRIDAMAETARAKYLTPILGQEYVYSAKLKEAESYLNDSNQDTTNFPFLSSEASVTGMTCRMVASTIRERHLYVNRRVAAIEAVRKLYRDRIDNCEDKIKSLDEILREVSWPQDPREL